METEKHVNIIINERKGNVKKMTKKLTCLVLALILAVSCFSMVSFAAVGEKIPFENSEFFTVGDYSVHYRIYGERSARPGVMLLHGFGLSTASFEGLAEEYADNGYFVVTVDIPNFGYSSRETSETELQSREDVVYALMTELGGRWIIGGHSMGGGIAINVATDHPQDIAGLVLFAPQTSVQASSVMSRLMKNRLVLRIFNSLFKVGTSLPFVFTPMVEMSFSDREYAKKYDVSRISTPLKIDGTGAGIAMMTSHTRGTDFEKFSALNVPVVIITSENDRVANADNLSAILAAAPEGSEHFTVKAGGHMMMEYNSSESAALTLPVMAKCA